MVTVGMKEQALRQHLSHIELDNHLIPDYTMHASEV
jgi:hypothetical protein